MHIADWFREKWFLALDLVLQSYHDSDLTLYSEKDFIFPFGLSLEKVSERINFTEHKAVISVCLAGRCFSSF